MLIDLCYEFEFELILLFKFFVLYDDASKCLRMEFSEMIKNRKKMKDDELNKVLKNIILTTIFNSICIMTIQSLRFECVL